MLPFLSVPAVRRAAAAASAALGLASAVACAHAPKVAFLPLRADEAALVLPLPRPPGAEVRDYLADGRLTALVHGERLRAPLRLLVRRPDLLRLSVLAPQGSAAFVLASDGERLTSLDVGASAFHELPADADGLRALAPQFALGLSPQVLVSLLFGEATPPNHATLSASADALRFAWDEGGVAWRADLSRDDGRLSCLLGRRHGPSASAASNVARAPTGEVATVRAAVQRWSPEGLPTRLLLEGWPVADPANAHDGVPNGRPAHVLELDFDRVAVGPDVRDHAFVVRP